MLHNYPLILHFNLRHSEWRLKEGHVYFDAEIWQGGQNHLTSAQSRMPQISNETDNALKSSIYMASDSRNLILVISGCVKLSSFSNITQIGGTLGLAVYQSVLASKWSNL